MNSTKVIDNKETRNKSGTNVNEAEPVHICSDGYNGTKVDIPGGNDQNQEPQTAKTLITMDTVEFRFTGGKLSVGMFARTGRAYCGRGRYRLELLPSGGKNFRSGCKVYYRKEEFGKLFWDGIFKDLKGVTKFELNNRQLYDTFNDTNLKSLVEGLASGIGAKIEGLFRVDIAVDSAAFGTFADQVVKHRSLMPVRPSSMKGHNGYIDLFSGAVNGFTYGSRNSGRYIRCYNKSREISEKSTHKSYILDYWKANHLEQPGDIFRIETELRSNYLKKVKFQWTDIFDKKGLLKLVQFAHNKFFEFIPRRPEHDDYFHVDKKTRDAIMKQNQRINRDKRIKIIDFDQVKTDAYQRLKTKSYEGQKTKQLVVKQLLGLAALTPDEEYEKAFNYVQAACQMMDDFELKNYIHCKSLQWKQEFKHKSMTKGTGSINKIFGKYGKFHKADTEDEIKYDSFSKFMCELRGIDFEVFKYQITRNTSQMEATKDIDFS
jgi:hypothetical protein